MTAPAYKAIGSTQISAPEPAPDNFLSVSVPWPTHVAGDVGLLFVYDDGAASGAEIDPGVSWTAVATANGTDSRLKVFVRRAVSASEANAVITTSAGLPLSANCVAFIITYSGCVASGSPINVSATSTRSSTASVIFPAVTSTENDTMILLASSRDNDTASPQFSGYANASLSSIAERFDAGTGIGNGGGLCVAEGLKSSAGNTGASSATCSTSTNGGMVTLALRGITSAPPSPSSNFFFC